MELGIRKQINKLSRVSLFFGYIFISFISLALDKNVIYFINKPQAVYIVFSYTTQ